MRSVAWSVFGVLLAGFAASPAWAARQRPGEVVVLAAPAALSVRADGRPAATTAAADAVLERHGLRSAVALSRGVRGPHAFLLRSARPGFDAVVAARDLATAPGIRAAAPNLVLEVKATVPNDEYVLYQWHVNPGGTADPRLPEAWDITRGDTATVIAILETGFDLGHPDFDGQAAINRLEIPGNLLDDDDNGFVDDVRGWDFGNGDADVTAEPMPDPSGVDIGFHGTAVASVAVAKTNNVEGIAGTAWNCRFLPLKVGDVAGDITLAAVTGAFAYVVEQGAAVLNMSFGTPDTTARAFFQALADDAAAADIVCVAAAGNSGVETMTFPAACDGVLAVGATTETGTRASFSNWGTWVDIAAPGELVWSAINGNYTFDFLTQIILVLSGWDGENPYAYQDGTSFASPLVAGVCALVRARHPSLSAVEVAAHVVNTGDVVALDHPIGPRVNAFRAVTEPVVGVGPGPAPAARLSAAWPNPFGSATSIAFTLPAAGPVRLRIYDTSGRTVRELVRATFPSGSHVVLWDGAGEGGRLLDSGIYFAALETGTARGVRKLVLAR